MNKNTDSKIFESLILFVLTLLLGGVAFIPVAQADGTITVGGACSLVDAITAANTDAAAGGCSAGSGSDTVVLESGVTYGLTSAAESDPDGYGPVGLPSITSQIVIQGNGATIERSSGTFRLFYVASSGDLTLENVTLSNGIAQGFRGGTGTTGGDGGGSAGMGGAIFNKGALTITNSTFDANQAVGGNGGSGFDAHGSTGGGGMGGAGQNATAGGAGGGVNAGSPAGEGGGGSWGGGGGFGGGGGGSAWGGNTGGAGGFGGGGGGGGGTWGCCGASGGNGGFGGGNGGTGEGPEGDGGGGGGGGAGMGGAIFNYAGVVTIVNSTLSTNTAQRGYWGSGSNGGASGTNGSAFGGALFNYDGTVVITNTTFAGNASGTEGGAVYNYQGSGTATMNMTSVILADTTGSVTDCYNNNGTVNGTHNLIETNAGGGNACGTPASTNDPNLDSLVDNDGNTWTMALQSPSDAIDGGDSATCPTADQREYGRKGTCDIGAFEYNGIPPITSDSDGELTAAGGVSEPVNLPTTVDTTGEAVNVFDFSLSDGGGGDALALDVSQLVLHTSGTGDFSQVSWRLNGPDASNVEGTYDSGSNSLTFSGLSISVADGGSETYTLNAYFNDNTGLTEGQTFILSIDGDTDLTVSSSGTQMATTSAVNNGTGSAVAVTATRLVFSTQPSSPTERDSNMGPVTVQAQDGAGNVDTDFTETVSLTDEGQGTETDGPGSLATTSNGNSLTVAATSGQVSWANLSYDTIANINIQATSSSFGAESDNVTVQGNSDGNLTAAGGVSEPVNLPTTVDTVGEAVDVFDFSLSDGGGGDALALDVSQLVLHTSGTGDFSQVSWRLNGPDASNVEGTYDSSANTLTFSGLSISVAEGGSETYTVNAYFNDNTGLSEGQTFILSLDGDTDLTVSSSGTQMATTSAVDNGPGSAVAVTATRLVFNAQPSSPVAANSNLGPVTLQAQDGAGNVDTDFTETVSLTDEGQGTETDGPGSLATTSNGNSLTVAATSGQVSWANLSYDTIANINIQATSSSFGAESDNVTVQGNSDGNLTAAGGVSEPVNLPTTVDTVGEAVKVFDFSLSDGGGGDALALDVSQLVLHTAGTGDFSQVTWRLNGSDASNVEGTYDSGSNTLTFSGLTISVADGGSETYTLNAYFNDNTGLSEGQTYILSLDGDTDLTVSSSGTQMAPTSAVNNSTGSAVAVTATQLVFSAQPSSLVAANSNLGPVTLQAQDGAGNVDTDFTETVSLTDEAQGAETDGPGSLATSSNGNSLTVVATSGQVSWANLTYDTDANINIQASSSSFGVESDNVTIQSNQAPVALADAVTTIAGQALTIAVLGNDTDADGDPLSVSTVTQGTNGSVSNNGSTITYTPGGSYTGTDAFTYIASDGSLTDTAAVSVTVVEGDRADPIDPTQEEIITIDNHIQSGKFLSTTIELPPGSVPDSTTMVFKEQSYSPHNAPSGYYVAGMFFSLDAYVGADHQSDFTFTKSVTLTFYFNRVRRPSLRYWDGNTWRTDGITVIESDRTKMVVTINHLTEFALFSKVEPLYLPLVFKGFTSGSDLVVESVTATSSAISVTIRNAGTAAVTDPFWVDVYFDPTETPGLNKPWSSIAPAGAVWGVTAPIPAGDSLTLTVGDAYYASQWSSPSFPTGAQVYAYVDSINYETSYGNVQESNEGNNLSNPVTSTAGQGKLLIGGQGQTPSTGRLPMRE